MVPLHIQAEMTKMDMNALIEVQNLITFMIKKRIDNSLTAGVSLPCEK